MDLLNSEPVVSLSGDEFLPIEGKTFIQQVQEFFAAQGGKANSPFGTVLLDKKGIKNDLGHGIGRLKAASFAAVKDVLEKGVVINPMGQYHTNNKKNPTGMIAAPIIIGDEKYVCVVEVIANRQVTRLYVHEVTLTKNLQGDVADSNAVPGDNNLVTQPQGEIAKILRNYVNTKNNDENNSKTENRIHMNKKLIRLTESDLYKIVKESVNKILKEEYSTPPLKDRTSFANYANVDYYNGGIDDKEDFDSVAGILNQVYTHLIDIQELLPNDTNFELIGDSQNGSEKYFKYLTKCINRAQKCVSRIVNINQMNRGLQPRVFDPKNSKPRYKSVDIYNPENPQMS